MQRYVSMLWFNLLIAAGTIWFLGTAGFAQSGLPPIKTVFVIIEENKNWNRITSANAPYIHDTLVPMSAHAEQYYNPVGLHPSEPNYIWMEAGTNMGIVDDAEPALNHRHTQDHLVTYLDQAGVSWRAYIEDIDGKSCPLNSGVTYGTRHVPFLFFDDVSGSNDPNSAYCISHIRPYSELAADLANNVVARYNFIVPNVCHDMHDCSITTGDSWLAAETPKIFASQAFWNSGALFLTWDEGEDAAGNDTDGPIGMIVVSPYAKTNYSNTTRYTHSSFLRTLQEIFGATPLLADALNAPNLSDLFVSNSPAAATVSSILNNASYNISSAAVAPGTIAAIFGSNLTDGGSCLPPSCNPTFTNGVLNSTMSGAQVLVNGNPVPMLYATSRQLGIQIPAELAGASAAVQIAVQGRTSLSGTVPVVPLAPGIFSFTADGKGQGAITHSDGTPILPQQPARAGEMVTIYATGLGQVTPKIPTGTLSNGISNTVASTTVTIGGANGAIGITVPADFSGIAPCCVGLNQVNFRLPSGVPSGPAIPLFITVGGVQSNQVTISVQ